MLDYVIWDEVFSVDNADFQEPKSLYDVFFNAGEDVSGVMPAERIELVQEPGSGRVLPDYIRTVFAPLMNSPLRSTLTEFGITNVQYFPVTLLNPKGIFISEDYYISNVVGVCDCIDESKSAFTVDHFRKRFFGTMWRIVIDESRIDRTQKLFRLDRFPEILAVHVSIADQLSSRHGGMQFVTFDEHNRKNARSW